MAIYHCNITYPCSLCDKFIGNREDIKKHVEVDHGAKKNSGKAGYCSACNKTVSKLRRDFTIKETWKDTLATHMDTREKCVQNGK